jgi:hypothetical protein
MLPALGVGILDDSNGSVRKHAADALAGAVRMPSLRTRIETAMPKAKKATRSELYVLNAALAAPPSLASHGK